MSYDDFGNMTAIRVGNRNLAGYEYDSLRRLSKLQYANNQALTYTYDQYGRTETVSYPDGRKVTYAYNGDGNVHSIDEVGGDAPGTYIFEYDSLGRLMTWEKRSALGELGNSQMYVTQDFDASNRLIFQSWKYPMDLTFTNRYSYNQENGTMNAMDVGNDHANFGYDSLLRLSVMDCGILTRNYTYRDITATKTTSQVAKLAYPNIGSDFDFEYTYDSMGYIASYTTPSGNAIHYTYDNQGQLIRANDGGNGYTYTYDGAGNLLTSNVNGTSHTYTYGDGDWKDLLTAFDGKTITYDAIGNPLSYYNGTRWNFTWSNGRRLQSAANGTDSISYTYEADGQRVTKTVNGVVHIYYYANGLLMRETYGDTTLDFFYDANGIPFSMLQNRSTMYYYITNIEGDVIRLVDCYGNIAAMYKYDPFGREIYALGSHAEINPLRYRGYYYDAESKLYYVSSRYYDPEVGRFISADTTDIIGVSSNFYDKNLYAYCDNNPVMRRDASGYVWETVFDVVSLGFSIAEVAANPYDIGAWAGLVGDTIDLLPIVTGVGETVRGIRFIDKAGDTLEIAEAVDFTDDARRTIDSLENVNGFTKSTSKDGIKIHKQYKTGDGFKKNYKEYKDVDGIRPDYYDGNTIYELKPFNPKAAKAGIKQLKRYNDKLGGNNIMRLEMY